MGQGLTIMKYEKFLKLRKINNEVVVPAFHRAGLSQIANKIESCGAISILYECSSCGTREWKGFSRCKDKFCSCCNAVKTLSWLARTYDKFAEFLKEGKYITMLSLTVRDRSDLRINLDLLNKAWRLFYHDDRSSAREFHWKFSGGVKSLEVKTGENSGLWHPHFHCLLIKDRFSYDKAFLDYAWKKCVKLAGGDDDEGICHIESIYIRDENGEKVFDRDALIKAIVESFKYISKMDYSSEKPERISELVECLKGVRQIDTFGCCKNIGKDVEEDLKDDKLDSKIVSHVCQVCGCSEATLVDMLTDNMKSYNGLVLLDKDEMKHHYRSDDFVDIIKEYNGKLIKKDDDHKTLEEVFYQSSIFDN